MFNCPFRSVLGGLLYLSTRTRPDIATAVSMMAKFQAAPRPVQGPTGLLQDNLGAISWSEGVQGLRSVKHVGMNYHNVRDMVDKKFVSIDYTPSTENRADCFTKVLIGDVFVQQRAWLGVRKVAQPP